LAVPIDALARAGVRSPRAPSPAAMKSAGISGAAGATDATALPRIAFTLRT
jgi:hypothetical protein